MVFFTCFYCGESVKKPSVNKHYQLKCKNKVPFLTCVDCLNDFRGTEHEIHTKCITEEEKYSAKGFVPKPSSNKGERKQKAWNDFAHELLSSDLLKPDEKEFLEFISRYSNLPRKKVKFMNFLKNTARQYMNKPKLIEVVWQKLEHYFKEFNLENQKTSEPTGEVTASNGKDKCEKIEEEETKAKFEKMEEEEAEEEEDKMKSKKKKKKRKKSSVDEEEENDEEEDGSKKKKMKTDVTEMEEGEKPKSKKSKKCDEQAKAKVDKNENVGEEKKTEGKEIVFDWKETILNVISTKGEDNKISLKKLQKKVLKKYCKSFEYELDDKIEKKFMKKLKKMSEVSINADYVSLNKP